jgi:shikimate dehydrogenase
MKYGLIGYPLGHSVSPLIHSEIFKITGHAGEYSLYEMPPEKLELPSFLDGFNVTIPHKESIIKFCEKLDESADCGAVNCVKNRVGYNTDVYGFKKAIETLGADLSSKVCLLGHGGSGKMVAREVKKAGGSLTIATRENIDILTGNFDLLINSTPVGMFPNVNHSPINFTKINAEYVLDLIYNPAETKLLSEARQKGIKAQNGLIMLVWQAIKSHEIWYGGKISEEQVNIIIEALK